VRKLVRIASFPDSPGVYVVYRPDQERPLYVGVAATQTIAERWRKQHLYPRAGGSALRRSLGLHLGRRHEAAPSSSRSPRAQRR